ncbi:MAG: undecaprenyl-diphosphate phosphatase [Clostridium argentinense]|uniref:Undecaprenyl-diphosphatase n=1 Tax=Clostridium faecium TaxID=2762223 RepID=A0ABR8YP54_9CLOT|nr:MULTISPECIES: undecaprenyl-diphosphate phosphatase [Clostridium]MBD8046010.1 undecaprenyl-diphosphate phosphatase [Clostridium faecium]MBS5825515.1 undecaprenyl-diphosphate phosphatase [Clostridium argentinense]MDU1350023.1 undecaprenyl-diphosphate phosphatase [Clostridium argentinense]
MILILKAIVIAIVEGITEFIPISSTGHMIIVGDLINFKGSFANLFEVVIQLGAILAILVLYWDKIFSSIKGFFTGKSWGIKFWTNIFVACIPIGILGFVFEDLIDKYLFNSLTVAIGLIIGGILLLIAESKFKKSLNTIDVDNITTKQALKVGIFQCLALWPGMSRASSTIIGGWVSGISTVAATEFSFFLAIPAMIGASGVKLIKYGGNLLVGEIITLAIGFIVAFIVALIVVDKFINYLKKKPMKVFAVYRIIVGLVLFLLLYMNIISM